METVVGALIVLVAVASAGLRLRRARLAGDPVPPSPVRPAEGTRRVAAELLARLEASPSGRPDPTRPTDGTLRLLLEVGPATLLVPFADADRSGSTVAQGTPVARGRLVVTNRELRFCGDQGMSVRWAVPTPDEVVRVSRGVLLPPVTPGGEVRGIGVEPDWVPVLPVVLRWARAVHDDTSLAPVRSALVGLAEGHG